MLRAFSQFQTSASSASNLPHLGSSRNITPLQIAGVTLEPGKEVSSTISQTCAIDRRTLLPQKAVTSPNAICSSITAVEDGDPSGYAHRVASLAMAGPYEALLAKVPRANSPNTPILTSD